MSRVVSLAFVVWLTAGCSGLRPPSTPASHGKLSEMSRVEGEIVLCEHKAPEKVCTKHHPQLIAQFQRANDWCKPHGVPESWLLGRATWSLDRFILTGRAGAGLPLGRVEEDPFARGRAGLSHQHIQFGTGTVYPVMAIDVGARFGRVGLSAYLQTMRFLTDNQYGYQAGNRYVGGVAGDAEVMPSFRVGLGTDILNEQPERWGGVVQQDGNVGRTDVLVGGLISYAFGTVTASVAVKVPVYQHFIEVSHGQRGDPGQLTFPAIVNLAVHTTFGADLALPPTSVPAPSPTSG